MGGSSEPDEDGLFILPPGAAAASPVTVLPYATAPVFQQQPVWRSGALLVVRRDSVLPPTCVKCNQTADGEPWRKKLYWHPPTLYFMIGVLSLVFRKSMTVEAGLCAAHAASRRRAVKGAWALGVSGMACFAGGVAFVANSHPHDAMATAGGVMIAAGVLFPVVAMVWCSQARRVLWPKRIDDTFGWFAGHCPAYLDQFPPMGR